MNVCVCVCVCVCVYIYIYMHICTHTYIYIYIYKHNELLLSHEENEIVPFVAPRVVLEDNMLSEKKTTNI